MSDVINALADTPHTLRAVVATCDPHRQPSDGGWTPAQIVGHIRAADTIWRHRILLLLVHDGIVVPDVDERALQTVHDVGDIPLDAQLDLFEALRQELVSILRALPPDAWTRTCTHASTGPLDLRAALAALADHEAEHLTQLGDAARA